MLIRIIEGDFKKTYLLLRLLLNWPPRKLNHLWQLDQTCYRINYQDL